MQGDGDQVDAVFEDHAPIQAKSLSRTQAGETSEISQELDSPTQSDSEQLQRNPYEGGPLRSPFITSSSGNPQHINNVAGADNRDVHEQSIGVESPSSPASQVTQPSYEDSTALSADHAAAMAAVHPSSILAALQRVRPLFNFLINTHGQPQAALSEARGLAEEERLFIAGSSQPFSPVVMFNESSEITFAALGHRTPYGEHCERLALDVPLPEPSSDLPINAVLNGTLGAHSSRERNGSGASGAPDDGALSSQQATEDDARHATANARTRIAGPSLERFVGAHARRMTLGQRNEASVRVRVLPDLEVLEEGPCRLTLMLANDEAGAAEGTHHLAEWETFTRALLTVHVCIHCLTLSIPADSRSPRHFNRGFSLRDGTAVIDVEVSAFRDPWIDFVLPYLRSLSRLRMVEQADIGFQDVALLNRDVRGQEMFRELLQMDARLELDVNRNLARLLDATRDMPFLRQLVIYLDNAGTEPWEPRQISLNLTQHFCTDVRRLRYEVDATYAQFLRCQCANHRGVSTTTGVETSMIPTLCARRELTGCTGDLVPYIVSVTHPTMLGTYVIHVLCIVCRPVEE
ncbi:uncharacterized protein [Dermacentor albipictus]|uniref:uncharacterized protein n=1 Tax=Dermacentor albipictus TaxID=60249 RepID=UPI0038FBFE78